MFFTWWQIFSAENDKGIASYNMQKKNDRTEKHNIPVCAQTDSPPAISSTQIQKYDMGFSAQDSKTRWDHDYAAQNGPAYERFRKPMSQQENRLITDKRKKWNRAGQTNGGTTAKNEAGPNTPFTGSLFRAVCFYSNELSLQILEDSVSPDPMVISRDYFNNDNLVRLPAQLWRIDMNKAAFADNAYLTMMMDSSNALYSPHEG